jgi:hypothetical protein
MIIVLVHGWSVTSFETYGELPARLRSEIDAGRLSGVRLREIWLGSYVSFRDEVRVPDLALAFEHALRRELASELAAGERLAVITHSTGGPVVRDWWDRFYRSTGRPCPLRHLVMLAPANFGSALAQLGKGRISKLKSMLQFVEPGTGVLDWLEHGSPEAFELNRRHILGADPAEAEDPVFLFVLTGQKIDRALYDHVNAYTGEAGSDGVVRVAAANMNARYMRLVQQRPPRSLDPGRQVPLRLVEQVEGPKVAFGLIPDRAHSGEDHGILRSVRDNATRDPTVSAILDCLKVETPAGYRKLTKRFEQRNARIREQERLEIHKRFMFAREYFNDAHALLIVRIRDSEGRVPESLDFKFTGKADNPDNLPAGFIRDGQRNRTDPLTLSFYTNADRLLGCAEIRHDGEVIRRRLPEVEQLGLEILPRPRDGFVGYAKGRWPAGSEARDALVSPDRTTLVDIVLQRVVRRGSFELGRGRSGSFEDQLPGTNLPPEES